MQYAPLQYTITALVTGSLAILYLALSLGVAWYRVRHDVALGDGGSEVLARRIRAHENFGEYVPISLSILLVLELSERTPTWFIASLGIALVTSRFLHAIGLVKAWGPGRSIGAGLAFLYLSVGGGTLFVVGVERFLAR